MYRFMFIVERQKKMFIYYISELKLIYARMFFLDVYLTDDANFGVGCVYF